MKLFVANYVQKLEKRNREPKPTQFALENPP